MSFRSKSACAHLFALAFVGAGWFYYMPWAIARAAALPEVATIGTGILLAGNGLLYLYLRTLRCPGCLTRFGPKMYKSGIAHLPWPREDCWNCGADLKGNGKQGAGGGTATRTAASSAGFPLRWRAILVLVIVWNALGLASLFLTEDVLANPKRAMAVSLGFLLAVAWGTKHIRAFQNFILAEGHSVTEIKRLLTFIQAFALFALLALGIGELAQGLTD